MGFVDGCGCFGIWWFCVGGCLWNVWWIYDYGCECWWFGDVDVFFGYLYVGVGVFWYVGVVFCDY